MTLGAVSASTHSSWCLLLIVNALGSSGWWVQWPLFGWGALVFVHGALAFGRVSELIGNPPHKKVRELSQMMSPQFGMPQGLEVGRIKPHLNCNNVHVLQRRCVI